MAKKKDQNEDPEEEKKNQFEEDEDFGLPDLDYDELEEETEEASEPVFGITEEELKSEVTTETEEEKVTVETSDGEIDENWEKELEEELQDELNSGEFDDTETFYEEESFEEFEDSEEQTSVGGSIFGIDEKVEPNAVEEPIFGGNDDSNDLDTVDEPVVAAASGNKNFEPQYSEYLDENNNNKGKFARTVVIGTVLFLVIGSVLWFLYDSTSKKTQEIVKEVPPKETPVETTPLEVAAETKVLEPVEEKAYNKKAESVPNQVEAGTITILSLKTGKSYVVIGSFFDEDIAGDYAQKLADQGSSPYIIPPFNNSRYYRVAIAEFDNFKDANGSVATYTEQYGKEAWPLRY